MRVPIVPLQRNVSNGFAPKNTAQIIAISAIRQVIITAAGAGVSLRPVLARAWFGARSRTSANSIREAPTTHARQHANALTLAPSGISVPPHGPMYDVPRSPISADEPTNLAMPALSVPNAI